MTPRRVRVLGLLLAGLALSWLPARSFNWDALAYLGCAAELRGATPAELHAEAYGALDEHAEPKVAASLRSKNAYREACSSDPEVFAAQLPFYRGRVLYLGAVAGLTALGLPPVQALFAVSWLGGLLLVTASWCWVRSLARRAGTIPDRLWLRGGLVLFLLALGMAHDVPARGTPDALAAGLLVGGAFLLTEARRPALGLALLVLALAARADALVLVLPLLAWQAMGPGSASRLQLGLAGLASVAVVLACTVGRGAYDPWTVLFHTFIDYRVDPVGTTPPLSLAAWWGELAKVGYWFRWEAAVVVAAGASALVARRRALQAPGPGLVLVALVGATLHLVLFPALWPRMMLPYWALVAFGIATSGRSAEQRAA
mgnify:FL=1